MTNKTWLPQSYKNDRSPPLGLSNKCRTERRDTARINKKMTDDFPNRGPQESEDDYSDGEGGSTGGVKKVLTRISK